MIGSLSCLNCIPILSSQEDPYLPLADLHDKYVIAPANKASNNICKSYYSQIINEELGSASTYTKCTV